MQVRAEELSKLNDVLHLSFRAQRLDNKVWTVVLWVILFDHRYKMHSSRSPYRSWCVCIFVGHVQQVWPVPRIPATGTRRHMASCSPNRGKCPRSDLNMYLFWSSQVLLLLSQDYIMLSMAVCFHFVACFALGHYGRPESCVETV